MSTPIEEAIVAHAQSVDVVPRRKRIDTPRLRALHEAGTQHVYADTADVEELGDLLSTPDGALREEIDGNTVNQPLVRKVVERHLDRDPAAPRAWASELRAHEPSLSPASLVTLLYAILSGRIGNDMARTYGGPQGWEVSLQLHMALAASPESARWVGRLLREMTPSAIVKVPFTPDAPHCLLVARDLERAGIPVNVTSTFSARQAVTAAVLSDASRTNVFMGRLNQGLEAQRLGEHVDLEAQRALRWLRAEHAVKTRLIVASIREWETFVRVAGCDVFTAPCGVLADFVDREDLPPEEISSQLETSYADALGIAPAVLERLGSEHIARLHRVEPELVEFLLELRGTAEFAAMEDGETLFRRFDDAGFADVFHDPSTQERREIAESKLPRLDGVLVDRIALDTHYSLLANADFEAHQKEIDDRIRARLDDLSD